MGSNKTPELVSLVLAMLVIIAAMQSQSCTDGETDLLYTPRQEIRELVAEESAYIFDFDGSSSIEAPTQAG